MSFKTGKISALKHRLTWVCHGATASNRTATFPLDEPLEKKAAAQTKTLATLLERVDHTWISPTLRARQTAEILGLRGEPDAALRECDYGRWSGRSIAELHATEPDKIAEWMSDPAVAPHGGESLAALSGRVSAWLDLRSDEGGHTVAITHASIIRAALLHVLRAPPSAFWNIDIEPLSVVRMSGDGRRWTLSFPRLVRAAPIEDIDGSNEKSPIDADRA
jgi:broad specificity phosphatase PhoE